VRRRRKTNFDDGSSNSGRVVSERLETLSVVLREGGGRSVEIVEAAKEFPARELGQREKRAQKGDE
jgi:hypothetical protein